MECLDKRLSTLNVSFFFVFFKSVAGLDDVNFSELNLHAEPSEGSFVITNFENVDIESIKKTEIEPKKGKRIFLNCGKQTN